MGQFLDPNKVLSDIDVKFDTVAADFGSSSGAFAIPLARKAKNGIIYALDVQEARLSNLKVRAFFEKLKNIKCIHCDLENKKGSTLSESSLDLVVISNVLFQAKDKSAIISEASRVLKKGGKLVLVDWSSNPSYGPEDLVNFDDIKAAARETRLSFHRELDAGDYHKGLIFFKE